MRTNMSRAIEGSRVRPSKAKPAQPHPDWTRLSSMKSLGRKGVGGRAGTPVVLDASTTRGCGA